MKDVIADQIYGHLYQQKNRKDGGKDLEGLMIYFILIGEYLEKSVKRI